MPFRNERFGFDLARSFNRQMIIPKIRSRETWSLYCVNSNLIHFSSTWNANITGSVELKTLNNVNIPFPSFCEPHYKTEAKCKSFLMTISFVCKWIKTNFHNKNFALSLAFIMRFKATVTWETITGYRCTSSRGLRREEQEISQTVCHQLVVMETMWLKHVRVWSNDDLHTKRH